MVDISKSELKRILNETTSRTLGKDKPHLRNTFVDIPTYALIDFLQSFIPIDDAPFFYSELYNYLKIGEIANTQRLTEESRLNIVTTSSYEEKEKRKPIFEICSD